MSITTEQLIAQAKEGADLTNVADYVTDAQWLAWLNNGVDELHRLVTNKFKATYFRTYDFTLAEGESEVVLPANFWRLKGLDLDPDTVRRREVRPYNFAERNRYRQNTLRDLDTWCQDRRYNLVGSRLLKIQAQEQASGNYRLYFTPKPKILALVRTIARQNGADQVETGEPDVDHNTWTFINANFDLVNDLDGILTISGDVVEFSNNGSFPLTEIVSASVARGARYTSDEDEVFADAVVATVTRTLDPELEPFSEYVWLTASIKSLIKEESYAQANMLKEQRNLIRADLMEALETDQGGPATIIDTDDVDGGWSW